MTTISKQRLSIAIAVPFFIFAACAVITFLPAFQQHPDKLSLAIIGDLLLTAPVAYYFVIRKTSLSRFTALRVFVLGVIVAGILLSKNNSPVLTFVKTCISPLAELTLIGFIVWKFYTAKQQLKKEGGQQADFLAHCRAILTSVLGSEKVAHVFASEVAVFYYLFSKKDKSIDYQQKFTGYKDNGIILIFGTFLSLFIIETIGMHFIFLLWSKTAAWILTSLSFYTCLQLLAHIKALKSRPVVIGNRQLLLRNGLMGGDATVALDAIAKIEMTNKLPAGKDVVKIALLKALENHNIAIYVNTPVTIVKAFGVKKKATILLINIDRPKAFMEAVAAAKQ